MIAIERREESCPRLETIEEGGFTQLPRPRSPPPPPPLPPIIIDAEEEMKRTPMRK